MALASEVIAKVEKRNREMKPTVKVAGSGAPLVFLHSGFDPIWVQTAVLLAALPPTATEETAGKVTLPDSGVSGTIGTRDAVALIEINDAL